MIPYTINANNEIIVHWNNDNMKFTPLESSEYTKNYAHNCFNRYPVKCDTIGKTSFIWGTKKIEGVFNIEYLKNLYDDRNLEPAYTFSVQYKDNLGRHTTYYMRGDNLIFNNEVEFEEFKENLRKIFKPDFQFQKV